MKNGKPVLYTAFFFTQKHAQKAPQDNTGLPKLFRKVLSADAKRVIS